MNRLSLQDISVIAAELDLSPPSITEEAVEAFFGSAAESYWKSSTTEKVYWERNGRAYPWERRVLCIDGVYQEGAHHLSSMVAFAERLVRKPTVTLIQQHQQPTYDFAYHFDGERPNLFGFRVCYGLRTDQPFVRLARLTEEGVAKASNKDKLNDTHVESATEVELIPLRSDTVILLNAIRHPHKVPVTNNATRRKVFLIQGALISQTLPYLQRLRYEA